LDRFSLSLITLVDSSIATLFSRLSRTTSLRHGNAFTGPGPAISAPTSDFAFEIRFLMYSILLENLRRFLSAFCSCCGLDYFSGPARDFSTSLESRFLVRRQWRSLASTDFIFFCRAACWALNSLWFSFCASCYLTSASSAVSCSTYASSSLLT
jgi:hypothetical protein